MLVNGKTDALISPLDRGLQYGDGLFETILVEFGCATFLQEHLCRLQKGCDVLGFPVLDIKTITDEVSQLVSDKQHGVIKIILTRGVGERGFLPPEKINVTRVIMFSDLETGIDQTLKSINLVLCKTCLAKQPLLSGIKHLNQLERILARSELRDVADAEGLMLDTDGSVIEGTMSNIFIVKDDFLITTRLDNCGVEGVIRKALLQQAEKEGITCKVEKLSLDDVKNSDEIFMTNSLMPVRVVKQLILGETVVNKEISTYAVWAKDTVLAAIKQQVNVTLKNSI
ncbi:MAG: 4-amino-4-deoxychorismate lyase [Cycloclasticus sp. symbiont of Bathymodiolus heckerae]|nr:MAG: 4-amino-4-deoxychorismate lyase [Cycloclasticus sp. symbiont of Bathymodiolus heckerae]